MPSKLMFQSAAGLCALFASSAALAGDLATLHHLQNARTRRVSSAHADWRNTNGDSRPLPPGQTLSIADVAGPGVIRHIWFTISSSQPEYGRWLTLRMYWDGQEEPAVETPIGDFFAVGHGQLQDVTSMPVAVSSEGRAMNCYWSMPFASRARITLTNDSSDAAVRSVYWYVDYEEVDELAPTAARFHAQYRQEYPARMAEDYLILDAEGHGHYVGTVLSVALRTPGWFGEGDDRFYIDGAEEPQLKGTGTEDYFCDAWGFRLLNRPYYGITLNGSGRGRDFGDLITAYRWHIQDPVHFTKSLKVTIEDKGNTFDSRGRRTAGFAERQDLVSSVAFWYQTGKAKRFATMPPAAERVIPRRLVQFESVADAARPTPASTPVQIQDGPYSGGRQLWVKFAEDSGEVTVPFRVEKPLQGLAWLRLTRSRDYGIFHVLLDGKALPDMAPVDLYHPAVTPTEFRIGMVDLPEGEHQLTFRCAGKNPQSKGYLLGIDALEVRELTRFVSR